MRNFASPSRYIQGENALFENAKPILELGSHPVLLCDSVVYDIVGERLKSISSGMALQSYQYSSMVKLLIMKSIVWSVWQKKMAVIWLLDLVEERPSTVQKRLPIFYNHQLSLLRPLP